MITVRPAAPDDAPDLGEIHAAALMDETLRLHDDGIAGVHLWTMRETPHDQLEYSRAVSNGTGSRRR